MDNADQRYTREDFDPAGVSADGCDLNDVEGDDLEICLDKCDPEEWRNCIQESWGVIPHGKLAGCPENILVLVDGRAALTPQARATHLHSLLDSAREHLKLCPSTKRILFYVVPPESDVPLFLTNWRLNWIDFRSQLEKLLPAQTKDSAPVLRVCVRGRPELCYFLENGRPAGCNTLLFVWWRKASPIERGWLRESVRLIRGVNVERNQNCAFIDHYTDQPPGLNGINLLTFGEYKAGAVIIQNWRMRVYLTLNQSIMPIGISGLVRHPNTTAMQFGTAPNPHSRAWVAGNLKNFHRNPFQYMHHPVP